MFCLLFVQLRFAEQGEAFLGRGSDGFDLYLEMLHIDKL